VCARRLLLVGKFCDFKRIFEKKAAYIITLIGWLSGWVEISATRRRRELWFEALALGCRVIPATLSYIA
jgi:hypothetical protein